MWHGTYAWGWGGRYYANLDLGLCCTPMPHGPHYMAHPTLNSWTWKVKCFIQEVCAIICVWKFSTEFPTKMVNLNNLLLTFTLNLN